MADRKTLVVIDDSKANIKLILTSLGSVYKIIPFTGGAQAIEYFRNGNTCSLILLDVEMPAPNGFETLKIIKGIESARNIPIIFLTSHNDMESEMEGLALGAADYISKPMNPALVRIRIDKNIKLDEYSNRLEHLVKNKTQTIEKLTEVVIFTIVSVVGCRDQETGGHITRTSMYITTLAESLIGRGYFTGELNGDLIENMRRSAPLHDIGKVGIEDSILKKPGRLTDFEFEEMKKHTLIGGTALREARMLLGEDSFLDVAEPLALYHHERWDGSGYPSGLREEEVPLCARIMAIADVYDALISERPYKKAFTHEKACEIILSGSGQHFDPRLCEVFESINGEFSRIAKEFEE